MDAHSSPPRRADLLPDALRRLLGHLALLWVPSAGPAPRFVATALCGALGLLAAILALAAGSVLAAVLTALAAIAIGGARTTYAAVQGLREGRPDINLLMILAALVALALGHWNDGVLLLFLFSLSDALENYAIERTRRGVTALMSLRPDTASLVRDGRELQVAIDQLQIGDLVRVRPGERFPIDGEVVEGQGSVDESIVTGESQPVHKEPGAQVFAATMNNSGALLLRVTHAARDSTLARIVHLVEHAQESKPPAQRLIERWQSPYTIGVLGACVAVMILWVLRTGDAKAAIYASAVLLVAASPCAVVLASPVAILAAVTRGARLGILFKGGIHLERLARVATVAFDKTGTLTMGKPTLVACAPIGAVDETQGLQIAVSLAHLSAHPLSQAIVAAADARGIAPLAVRDFHSAAGMGLSGRLPDGQWVGLGNLRLFEHRNMPVPSAARDEIDEHAQDSTVLALCEDGSGAVLVLRDVVRPYAADAIDMLRGFGVSSVVMLSGDRRNVAERIAREVGVPEVMADLKPEDKLAAVLRLAKRPGGVAMVGDGVNDAPALAAASVGVAMGASGADVALDTADVVLMRDDLRALAEALHLAQHAVRIIRQSLSIALGMIAVLVVLTLSGAMVLPLAVIGHEGSTVLVVLNGLRLLGQDSALSHLRRRNRSPLPSRGLPAADAADARGRAE